MSFICKKCNRSFKRNCDLKKHLKRKVPCDTDLSNIGKIIDQKIEEKMINYRKEFEELMYQKMEELKKFISPQINNNYEIEDIDEEDETIDSQFTFIEVCAGGGGLSSGFIKAGFKPLLLNDMVQSCCDTLEKNHPNTNIICDSLLNLDLTEYKHKVDVLMGGVPCQSFSHAGSRKGLEDERGDLILKFKNLIDIVEPKIFLIENVAGLKSHNKGKTFKRVIENLSSCGKYDIKYDILNSVDYNVPQKRKRMIIIGVLKSLKKEYQWPKKCEKQLVLRDVLLDVPDSEGSQYSETKKKVLDLVPQGGCWVDLPEDIQKEYMGKSYFSGGGKRGIARRLSMDEPSLTIMCTPQQKQTERCHPTETRPFTIRESARIQTFPDDYIFCGSVSQQYKQIGNAVPVEFARHIALSVKNILENNE